MKTAVSFVLLICISIVALTGCEKPNPPTASFELNYSSGKAPLDVIVTNTSLFAESYQIDFGDGTFLSNPTSNTTFSHGYTKAGSYSITLSAKGFGEQNISDNFTQTIEVFPGNIAVISTPSSIEVVAGETKQLSVTAEDEYGNSITPVQATWSINATKAGAVDANGLYAAGHRAGRFPDLIQVQVSDNGKVMTELVSVEILPGPLEQLGIAPKSIDLGIGMQQRFVAVGADKYGNRISGLEYVWSTEGDAGSITETGVFTAGDSPATNLNAVKVEAKQDEIVKSVTAKVTVMPDRIAFLSARDAESTVSDLSDIFSVFNLYVMNTDGTDQEAITSSSRFFDIFAPSPDGRRIAYSVRGELRMINYDGSWETVVPFDQYVTMPAWSPDGETIAFASLDDSVDDFSVQITAVQNKLKSGFWMGFSCLRNTS